MTNPAPPRERTPKVPAPTKPGGAKTGAAKRQVSVPGSAKPDKEGVRGGLLLLGLVLVVAAGGGFWYILESVDQRQEYLMTARTIERWEVVNATDFVVVEANVGDADAVPVGYVGAVLGGWATGRIPARTLVTLDMFEPPPLSGDDETNKVLIEVELPTDGVPGGVLETGDKVALFGAENSDLEGVEAQVGLIGVLTLEQVEGNKVSYVVTPAEAKTIHEVVDRYQASSNRRIWKVGFDLSSADLDAQYDTSPTVPALTEPDAPPEPPEEP